jgi:hypothetical protein
MALNFPDAPEVGDVYTFSNRSWTWSGSVWTPNRPQYTPDRDIVTDGDGYLVVSDVTSTEVGYLDGVTSNIQSQLDSKALLEDPAFVGTPTAPTATADTATTQLATTGFVIGQASSTTPIVDGSAEVGTSSKYARADHVHPTDTSRAPVASPTFTGAVTVSASGITFPDGSQTKQGVPSLTEMKPVISANATLSTLTNALTYRDAMVPVNGAYTITVDPDTTNGITFPVGTSIDFYQTVADGGASFVAGATVNLLATPGLIFRALYSSATITKVAANTWLVYGDLTA